MSNPDTNLKGFIKKVIGRPGRMLGRRLKTPIYSITREYRQRLKGLETLEIGGPTDIFGFDGHFPIYSCLGPTDNVNFSQDNIWKSESGKFRDIITGEATDLTGISPAHYKCVISSHCLEHIANPIKALLEWKRVLHYDGLFLLIVPNQSKIFDHKRPTTSIDHMFQDYDSNAPETDMTHLEEILSLHDLSMDLAAGTFEQFKQRCIDNYKVRAMHHHTFTPESVSNLLKKLRFDIIRQNTPDHHIITLASNNLT